MQRSVGFRAGSPDLLFEGPYVLGAGDHRMYDLAPDGRFIMAVRTGSGDTRINVVLNWHEELKRLVPTED